MSLRFGSNTTKETDDFFNGALSDITDALQGLVDLVDELTAESNSLEEELSYRQGDIDEQNEHIRELANELDRREEDIITLYNEIDALKDEVEGLTAQIQCFQGQENNASV